MMKLSNVRERFLTIMSTKLYTQLEPRELNDLHGELEAYLKHGDMGLTEVQELSLMEMCFYLNIYMSDDMNAQVIYNTLRDRLGDRSPKLYVMNATLLQINENDLVAIKYLEKLISEEYEYDSDPATYGLIVKKILSIKFELSKIGKLDKEESLLQELNTLIEKFPLDPELWWYLGNLYLEMGQLDVSIYCFEEVILIMPFNYVGFARVAEIKYYKALKNKQNKDTLMTEALNNALRSVELSELYLKGWSFVACAAKELGNKNEILSLATKKINEIAKVSNHRDQVTAQYILQQKQLV